MTSQAYSGGSGGIQAASSDAVNADAVKEVQSLKALSLNGLNKHMCHTSSATPEDAVNDDVSHGGTRPKPRLSWGDVSEIPGAAAVTTNAYEKHSGLPAGGASSSGNPWQVRSTQNPAKPLVRRPTPMALSVSKSVLGKGAARMTVASFEEEEEEEEEVDEDQVESPVPVSLRAGTNTDVLVVEDIEEEEEEDEEQESSTSKDLPLKPTELGQLKTEPPNIDTGSPTIVLQTDYGKEVSLNDIEEHDDNDEEDEQQEENEDGEEEENEDEGDKQFLLPRKSESYNKNPEPPANNTHVQSVPHHPRKLVRKQTPIALDLPEDIKGFAATKHDSDILEEEEEEEGGADDTQKTSVNTVASQIVPQVSQTNKVPDNAFERTGQSSTQTSSKQSTGTNTLDQLPSRPGTLSENNCNNNNHEFSSIISVDLVDGSNADLEVNHNARVSVEINAQAENGTTTAQQRQSLFKKSASCDGRYAKGGQGGQTLGVGGGQDGQTRLFQKQGKFKKSASCDRRDGSSSPSTTRRKVSPHHTKILTRQLTPLSIEVPKHVLTDAMKKKTDSFQEDEEEES